jgi:hypothetical protein
MGYPGFFCNELGNILGFCLVCIFTMRDTMENWQSEFLQLMWQVGGLAFLLYVGSPQSKESEQRLERKVDTILQRVEPEKAQEIIEQLKKEYPEK